MNIHLSYPFWTSPHATLLNLALAVILGSIAYGEKGAVALVALYIFVRILPLATPALRLSRTRRERLLNSAKLLGLPIWLMTIMLFGVIALVISLGILVFEKTQAQLAKICPPVAHAAFKNLKADIANPQTVRLMLTNVALFGILAALVFVVGVGR